MSDHHRNLPSLLILTLLLCFPFVAVAEEMKAPDHEIQGRGATLLFAGPNDKNTVALTFDDGPHPTKTPRILDLLEREDVKATFFLIGKMVLEYPKIVERILAEGHEIGNHTYNHSNLKNLGPAAVAREIDRTQEAIAKVCGYRPTLFRSPYGFTDLTTMSTLANQGLNAVFWSIDTEDWKVSFTQEILDEVLANLAGGAIILLHDHSPHTVEILPTLIAEIRGRGYAFETVSELFGLSSGTRIARTETVAETKSPKYFGAEPLPTPQLVASTAPPFLADSQAERPPSERPTPTPIPSTEFAVAIDAPKRAKKIYRLRPVEVFSQSLGDSPRTRVQGPQPVGPAGTPPIRDEGSWGYSRPPLPRILSR